MAHTWTWDKLVKSATRLNPKSRGRNYPSTPKFETSEFTSGPERGQKVIIPFVGTKSVLISLKAWGVTQSSLHTITLQFHGVDIKTEDPMDRNYFKIVYKGQTYWIQKLDKYRHPLTSRCSCFTGDTEILLADGTYKPIKDLVGVEGFDIISYNEEFDKFEKTKAFNCSLRGVDKQLVKVTLDDGQEIECTPDHRFLLRDGNWVEAQNLKENDSLRALYHSNYAGDKIKRHLPDGSKQTITEHNGKEDFYVYVYLDPRYPGEYKYATCEFSFKPIYVGKGRRNRCNNHWNCPNRGDYFHNTLKHLKSIGMEPIILKQQINLTEQVAYKLESQLTHEIGLLCEGNGPLLNRKHGGEGGLSGVAQLNVIERMQNNNPMKNKEISQKVRQSNIDNGVFELHRQHMIENNPMKNPETVAKMRDSYMSNFTPEELSQRGKYMASCRTEETFRKISQSHKTSERARKNHEISGQRLAALARKNAELGLLHTQTEAWKEHASKFSKANWENPVVRERMLQNIRENGKQRRLHRANVTIGIIEDIIKQYGFYHKTLYNNTPESYSKNGVRQFMIDTAYKNVLGDNIDFKEIGRKIKAYLNNDYINHKVKSVEFIGTGDVYCLTAEYNGNFVVKCKDGEFGVKSGVVVENCKDYFYTFSFYNYVNGHCLYGPMPRPYVRKTTWMPPRNKFHVPGVCKHIYNAWKLLSDSGLTAN